MPVARTGEMLRGCRIPPPAEAIAQRTGDGIARHRAPAEAADGKAELQVAARAAQREIILDERHDARDHGRVETEQESADRDRERHETDVQLALQHVTRRCF